jgi:hypothetical protein
MYADADAYILLLATKTRPTGVEPDDAVVTRDPLYVVAKPWLRSAECSTVSFAPRLKFKTQRG